MGRHGQPEPRPSLDKIPDEIDNHFMDTFLEPAALGALFVGLADRPNP
jgi:hypothetical protein